MATDYLNKIAEHVKLADESEATASEHNWAASRWVWEAVAHGVKQKDIAEAVNKSQAHITRLKKCWEIRVINQGIPRPVYAELGSFYQFYNSPEVHGESSRGDSEGSEGSGDRKPRDRGDYSTSGLVNQAWTAIDALARNPAHTETITEDELERLQRIPALIRRIIRQASLRRV